MEWIKTDDKLPKQYSEPILFVAFGRVLCGHRTHYNWEDLTMMDREGAYDAYSNESVTHWMPMPEPPTK